MSSTLEITQGDTGITISGLIKHKAFKAQGFTTVGCTLTVSCKRATGGGDIFTDRPATIGALDAVNGTIAVSYRLQTSDVDSVGKGRIIWKLTLPDTGVIRSPGPLGEQTYLQINAA